MNTTACKRPFSLGCVPHTDGSRCVAGISAFNRAPTSPSYIASVPEDLDLISIDYYNTTNPPAEAPQVIEMYKKYIFPRLRPHQSVMFVVRPHDGEDFCHCAG